MKAWWPVIVAILVPGGNLVALAVWLRRRWLASEAAAIDTQLAGRRETLEARRQGQTLDESMRANAKRRRAAVEHMQRHAAQIASGQPAEDRIRLVRR